MNDSRSSRRWRLTVPTTWLFWAGIGAAVALGGALRWPGISAAYPYLTYVDEGHFLHSVRETLATGRWEPDANAYPELPIQILVKAATALSPLAGELAIAPPVAEARSGISFYDRVEPPELILLGRSVSWLLSLGIILLTGVLGRRLSGFSAGVVAAWAAALAPALVMRGAIAMVDTYATFFTLAALVVLPLDGGGRFLTRAVAAGACGGLAVISKYPAAAVLPAIAITLVLLPALDRRRKLHAVALAVGGAVLAIGVLMPSAWQRPVAVLHRVTWHTSIYGAKVTRSLLDQVFVRQEFDLPQIGTPELGFVLVAAAVAGLAILVARRRTRAFGIGLLVFATLLVAATVRYSFQVFRNVLPLAPVACALAGVAVAALGERLRHARITAAAALAGLLALLLPAALASSRERSGLVDSRRQAIEWLLANRPPAASLLVAAEAAIPKQEVERLGENASTVPWSDWPRRLRQSRPRFLLTGNLRVDGQPLVPAADRAWILRRYQVVGTYGSEAAESGSWAWRGNHLRVWILRRLAQPAPPQPTN